MKLCCLKGQLFWLSPIFQHSSKYACIYMCLCMSVYFYLLHAFSIATISNAYILILNTYIYLICLYAYAYTYIYSEDERYDSHRFERISNIIKQFKLSCSKSQSAFQGMEVHNSQFTALIDMFTGQNYDLF